MSTKIHSINISFSGVKLFDDGEIRTSLVVDATGRSSETATKLAEHNLPKPRLICVNPHVSSASRIVKMPKDFEKNHDWLLLVCKTQPNGNRGGTLLPTEKGRWQVTLAEVGGPGPETTDEGFLAFAKTLPDQTMYNILKECEPVTPGKYNLLTSRREKYEDLFKNTVRLTQHNLALTLTYYLFTICSDEILGYEE